MVINILFLIEQFLHFCLFIKAKLNLKNLHSTLNKKNRSISVTFSVASKYFFPKKFAFKRIDSFSTFLENIFNLKKIMTLPKKLDLLHAF